MVNQMSDRELQRKVKIVNKLMTSHQINASKADEATRIRDKYQRII